MRAVLLAVAACAAFGAGIAGAASAGSPDPKLMVLRLRDLGVGFGRVSGTYVSNLQQGRKSAPWITTAAYIRWGRITGYEESFTKPATVGLVRVDSAASTYRTAVGAGKSQRASYRATAKTVDPKFVRLPLGRAIGSGSRLYRARIGNTITVYLVLWRWQAVRAYVVGNWVHGTARPESVVALARKQQERIRAEVP
jgi:hypothetical protein